MDSETASTFAPADETAGAPPAGGSAVGPVTSPGPAPARGTDDAGGLAAEAVKSAVRERYGRVARSGCGCGSRASSAAPEPASSHEAATPSACCEPDTRQAPMAASGVRELDLGCGNPLPFAGIRPGDTVLDLGSGSGAEVLRAARMVGPRGRAIGVDLTPEMLDLARGNARAAGVANAVFLEGDVEALPLPDESVDVIVSNCVLNLTSDKATAFHEAFRVLRAGGRFVVADIVVAGSREPDAGWRADPDGWSACAKGALTEEAYERGLRGAGFEEVRLERIAASGCGVDEAEVELVSDLISARKPGPEVVELGEAELDDVHALLHEAELTGEGLDVDALRTGAARVFGIRADGAAAGPDRLLATGAWEAGDAAVLVRSLAVRPQLRGRGLGGSLLHALLERARSDGAREAWLFTEGAEGFFATRGWTLVSRAELERRFPRSRQLGLCPASAAPMRRVLEAPVR